MRESNDGERRGNQGSSKMDSLPQRLRPRPGRSTFDSGHVAAGMLGIVDGLDLWTSRLNRPRPGRSSIDDGAGATSRRACSASRDSRPAAGIIDGLDVSASSRLNVSRPPAAARTITGLPGRLPLAFSLLALQGWPEPDMYDVDNGLQPVVVDAFAVLFGHVAARVAHD